MAADPTMMGGGGPGPGPLGSSLAGNGGPGVAESMPVPNMAAAMKSHRKPGKRAHSKGRHRKASHRTKH